MKVTDKIEITQEDNMALMAHYPDKYFDLAIVDPEYGIDVGNMNMGIGKSKKASKAKNRKWTKKDWDKSTPDEAYFKELFRVSKNQIIWGGNYFELGRCENYIIWDKEIPEGLSFSDVEFAWTSFKGANKIFRYSAYKNKKERIHPTQKPVALYKWLLSKYAKPNFKIIDTHFGSGSIAIGFYEMIQYWIAQGLDVDGAELVACELDKDYYDAAIDRIKRHTSQLSLFTPEELTQQPKTLF